MENINFTMFDMLPASAFNLMSVTLYSTIQTLKQRASENIVGKGENAGNQHFLLFPNCFLPYQRQKSLFKQDLICRLQMLSFWSGPKFCILGKELNFCLFGKEMTSKSIQYNLYSETTQRK